MHLVRLLLCCAALGLGTQAHAQSPTAKELFDNGQLHYDSGQYDLAIEAWTEAHRLSGRPILLIKMADAHEALGEHARAVELLQTYLDSAEESELSSIEGRIERLRTLAEATPEPLPTPEPAVTEPPAVVEPSAPARRSLALDAALGGGTLVGLGLGTGFGIAALSARSEAMEGCAGPRSAAVCTDAARDALERDRRASTLADVGFAVGGAALATWAVVTLTRADRGSLQVGVGPRGAALRWSTR